MSTALYKALPDGNYVAYDPRAGTYLVVGAEHVPPLTRLRLSQPAAPPPGPKGDGGRKARALLLMAMLEFQRRAHRVGMPDAAQPYLDHLAKLAADPKAARKAVRLSLFTTNAPYSPARPAARSGVDPAPYGYCPECRSPGVTAEHRINGNAHCSNGHAYPRKKAKFSYVGVPLRGEAAARLLALGSMVRAEDLADDGREQEPHVTVRYGLHTADPADVTPFMAGAGPAKLWLGKVSVFRGAETGAPFDVVKVDVDSPDLRRLNAALAALPHTDTHPEYQPHATIAYVKAGLGDGYAARLGELNIEAEAPEAEFSSAARERSAIRLSWRAEPYADGRQHRWAFKAVGEGPDAGRVLYGADAQRAIERQQQRGTQAQELDKQAAPVTGKQPAAGDHPEQGYSHKDFQAKKAAAYKAASKVASLASTREDITADHLKEMAGHLPYLTVAQLRSVRARLNTAFDVSFGGKSRRAAMVESVMGHVRKELDRMDAAAGNPVVNAPKPLPEAKPEPEAAKPAPESPKLAAPAKKEPWEMTREELEKTDPAMHEKIIDRFPTYGAGGFDGSHAEYLKRAIDSGKDVPLAIRRKYLGNELKSRKTGRNYIEPHEILKDEYVESRHQSQQDRRKDMGGRSDPAEARKEWENAHRKQVEAAVAGGKSVPADVLADYPDLAVAHKPPAEKTAEPAAAAPATTPPMSKAEAKAMVAALPVPTHLPDNPADYFLTHEADATVPLEKIKNLRQRPEGVENAAKFMEASRRGLMPKRSPLKVVDNGDGTYTVADGNSTFANAKRNGWKNLPVKLVPLSYLHEEQRHTVEKEHVRAGQKMADDKFFSAEEMALPKKGVQSSANDQAGLYAAAEKAKPTFDKILDSGEGVEKALGASVASPTNDAEFNAAIAKPGPVVIVAPLKGPKRAAEKVQADYGGNWNQLHDIVRASVAVDNAADIPKAMDALKAELAAKGWKLAKKPKNRFSRPTLEGYSDVMLNVVGPEGVVSEVQIHLKGMLKAKQEAHHLYEQERSLAAKMKTEGRDLLTPHETAEMRSLVERQRQIYGTAWLKSLGLHEGEGRADEVQMGHLASLWEAKHGEDWQKDWSELGVSTGEGESDGETDGVPGAELPGVLRDQREPGRDPARGDSAEGAQERPVGDGLRPAAVPGSGGAGDAGGVRDAGAGERGVGEPAGLPAVAPGAAQKPDDPAYIAAGRSLLADDTFRKNLADAYNHQTLFVEHRDGLVPFDRVYHELVKRQPNITVDQLHAALDALNRDYQRNGIEFHTLNEIAKVPAEERIATISRNDRNYHYARFKGGADAEKMRPPAPKSTNPHAPNPLDNGRTRDTLQEGSTSQGVSRGGLEQAGGADSGSGLRPQQPVGGEVASAPDAARPAAGEGTRGAAGRVSGGPGAALPGDDVAVPGAGADARRGAVGGAGGTAADAGEPDASVGDVGGRGRLVAGADQLPPVSRQEQSVAEPASAENPTDVVAGQNYRYPDREFFKGGPKAKFNANVEALKTLRTIQAEGRTHATPEEQAILARFTGWGQFPAVFDEYGQQGTSWEDRSEWAKERKVLKELLPADDWHAAARSTLNAHYTHPDIVDAHWQAAKQLGFGGGRFLETSAGVGYYLGMMPPEMAAKTKATAVELDPTTGGMLKMLYPKANTHVGGFETHEHPDNWFDVVASNVPFGDYRPYDPKYNKRRDYIHDYFFLKSAKQVRPGGLVMHITSTGTLDKLDPKVREELAETCDLVSAMRFPGNAHLENAGTAVVTDMVILRKRHPGEAPGDRSWLETVDVPDPAGGKPITVNKYFADHPEQILGHLDRSGEMRAADQKNVSAISAAELSKHVGRPVTFAKRDDDDAGTAAATKKGSFLFEDGTRVPSEVVKEAAAKVFKEKLAAAIGRLPAGAFKPHTTPPERLGPKAHPAPGHVKRGGFHVADGKLYVKEEGVLKERAAKPADLPRIQGHMAVRDAWRAVVNAEMAGKDATAERAALNTVYDGFVKKFGPLHDKKNRAVFDTDPDSPVVLSLEKFDKAAKKVTKADIFSKQTISAYAPATHAGSVEDGVGISLHEKGAVDPAHIAKLTGQPQEAVEKHLAEKGLAYRHPSEGWQRADQYLSGNVRQKLVMARAAAKSDPAYAANVAALEKVQPADIHHTHITPRLGAPWIPPSDVAAFAAFAAGGEPDHFALHYNEASGEWKADYTKRGKWSQNSAKAKNWQAGVTNKGFDSILEAALNGKMMRVYDGKGDDKVLNKDKTDALNAKIQELKDNFKSWVWDDAARRERLHRFYNDNFNNIRVTQYDGSHLTMPGKSPDMEIRPHVKNFVWQVVTTGKALAGHEVGVGKTRAMIASAMELRRLGLARKPAIACLKANVAGIEEEARALYPGAKILSTANVTDAKKRKQIMSQISSGDYDMVIMTHDHLNLMPMTPATVAKGIRAELDDLVAAKVTAEEAGNETQTKKLEDAQAKLEAKLKAATDERKKDDAVYFEETGIDHLFVDEAHEFKALPCYTQMEGMKGVPTRRSQKATNMLMRTKWLMEQNNGRGVVFATGTPISNSVGELYNMQRYLQPEELKARGITNFDAWVRTFAEPETKMEKKVTGDYGAVTRLAKFVNVPELLQMSRQVIDVRRADDIKKPDGSPAIKRPKRNDHFVAAENSPELDSFMASLIKRAKDMDPRDPTADNMLSICTDGRKAAIDLRLINPKAADDPNSKVNLLVQNVLKLHKQDGDSTQAIFSDLGNHPVGASKHGEAQIPEEYESDEDGVDGFGDTAADRAAADAAVTGGPGDGKFHLFGEIVKKLVAGGIPRDQIADFTTLDGEAREAAQQALREGRMKIALGGTKKLGTGVNIQDRLKHLHHLDAPWRPSDIEQRNGRGHRQGNKNEQVHVHTYVTKKSLDEFNWQVLASKAAFIGQAMTTDVSGAPREFSEIDTTQLSPEHLMAVASGNPHMLEKIQVDEDVKTLDAAKQRHVEEQRRLKMDLDAKRRLHETAVSATRDHKRNLERMDAAPKEFKIGGETFNEKSPSGAAAAALKAAVAAAPKTGNGYTQIGTYRGFPLLVKPGRDGMGNVNGEVWGHLETNVGPQGVNFNGDSPMGSIANAYRRIREDAEKAGGAVDRHQKDIDALTAEIGKPFPKADLHAAKTARQQELARLLMGDKGDAGAAPAGGAVDVDDPEETPAPAPARRAAPAPSADPLFDDDAPAAKPAAGRAAGYHTFSQAGGYAEAPDAEPVTVPGVDGHEFFVSYDDQQKGYRVFEARSGLAAGPAKPSKKAAIAEAVPKLTAMKDRLAARVEAHVKESGPSPRYTAA